MTSHDRMEFRVDAEEARAQFKLSKNSNSSYTITFNELV